MSMHVSKYMHLMSTCTHTYGRSQNKIPVRIRRTLVVIRGRHFESCHLHLVLSTCPTIMFFDLVILTATTTRAIRHVDNTR